MKFLIIVPDGSADDPIDSLGGKTPLEVAKLPCFDRLASRGIIGTCRTVPEGISPGSDSANLSVMGYDPRVYLTGRSSLEAGALGIDMKDDDESFRVNFVTLTPASSGIYEDFAIKDHAAGDITTEEASELLEVIKKAFSKENIKFYLGTQYRHCMIISRQPSECVMTPPHDILDRRLGDYLPKGRDGKLFAEMARESYELLKDHPINKAREAKGLNPANGIWIWGQGTRPELPDFNEKEDVVCDILFMVDTSGSISDEMLNAAYSEVKGAIDQFDGKLKGWLGFFDAEVTVPEPFGDGGELSRIKPAGGGGTDFGPIFDHVRRNMQGRLPACIVILTDGYAPFPQKDAAMGIPVLWLLNNEQVTPPWGKVARIQV